MLQYQTKLMDRSSSDSRSDYEIRQFKFDELPEYAEISSFKPQGFKTPEGSYKISSWREAYRIFCRYLLKEKPRHLRAFKNLEETFLGRRVMFSNDPFLLNDAYQLKSGFYAEIFLPPKSIILNISRLIQFCRLSPRQFMVTIPVYVDESELSEPEEVADDQNEVESQLAEPEPPLSQTAYFTLDDDIPDLACSKPVSITINTRRYSVSKWQNIVSETARYIYENDAESFLRYLYKNFGPKGNNSPLFSDKRLNLLQPCKIDSNLYVETDFSSVDCVKKALLFIRYANIVPSKVQIEYLPSGSVNSDNPTPSESANISTEPINTEPEEELEESAVVDNKASEQSQPQTAVIKSKKNNKNYYEFDNDLASGLSDEDLYDYEEDDDFDDEDEDDDFDDDEDIIGFQFYDNGKPVITPWLQKIIDAIEENYPEGIDFDNIDSVATIELASGERCNEDIIALLKMALFKNEEGFYYVPLRIADESTIQAMADFIDNGIRQYNAVSLSVINEKFQEQLDYTCDNRELAEFVEWYVFKEIDRLIAVEFNDSIGDGVCLLDSVTTDEFCETFYDQIENYLEKINSPVPMSQLRQLYPTLHETIISYALGDDRFGSSIQEETRDGQLFYSIRSDSHAADEPDEETASESEQAPELTPRSFTLDEPIPPLSYTKPCSIDFGNQRANLSAWRDIISQTAIYIDQNEPDIFNLLVKQHGKRGSSRQLFSEDQNLFSPVKVNSKYYVETHASSIDAVKRCRLFLQPCKLPLSEVRIEYLPAGAEGKSRSASSSLQVAADNASFTKPVNKSMFKTRIVVPTQCHNAFLDHLTNFPKAGTSVPVTIWFNGSPYSVSIYNPDFSGCGAPQQIRFTWNASSPIVEALKKECPMSVSLFKSGVRIPPGTEPDNVTVSLGVKPDEFIMKINDSSFDDEPGRQQELFSRSEEEVSLLCQTILQRAQDLFPSNSCHETQLGKMRNSFTEGEFTSDKELLDFITQNHLGVYSSKWVYFLTRAVEDCLFKMLEELQQEGQIIAYYNLLYDNKQDLFDSISVYKDETAISGLFSVLALRPHYRIVNPFYPTPSYAALKEDCTIKDALINYFEHNTVLTYDQIKTAFPYIPDTEIQEALRSDNDFILLENGSFTYYDKIYIDKALADKLLEKVESEIEKEDFISCNQIDLSPARIDNSAEITLRGLLDYFCKKILPAKYKRIGNVISDASKPVSSSAIIEKLCETKDCVTLNELKALADELSASWQTAFATAFEKMVRVDKDRFVSPSLLHFDVEEIDKVLEDNFVRSNDFIPLQDVTSFALFPQCGSFSWTWFLVESFCRKYSKKFDFMVAKFNSSNAGSIVRKSAKIDDYNKLMATAVNNNEIVLSENAVKDFLMRAHYIAVDNLSRIQNVLAIAQVLREEQV